MANAVSKENKGFLRKYDLSTVCQAAVTFVCVYLCVHVLVHVCICKFPTPPLMLAYAIFYSRDGEKEMLAPDSPSVLFLGRTYNYSNECIQKQHISWN